MRKKLPLFEEVEANLFWWNKFKDLDLTDMDDDRLYTARYDTEFVTHYLSQCDERWPSIIEFYNKLCAECYKRDGEC